MAEPTTLALITKTEVKAYFNIANTDYDDYIDAHLPGVRALVQQHCRHDFLSIARTNEKPYIKIYDTEFYLNYYPVASITSLTEGGTALTLNTDYTLDYSTGKIEKIAQSQIGVSADAALGCWDSEAGAIVVNYTGGHALTDDVTMAVKEMVGIDCGLKKRTYTDNEGIERVASMSAYPKHILEILDRHKYRGVSR